MIYVLCDLADLAALWAADRLRARGRRVEVVTAQVLECALGWRHALAPDGEAEVEIRLADGRILGSRHPAPVLNRLSHSPRARTDTVGGTDRDYAAQEMNALILSCLEALPGPVVNRPTPQGLCGRWRHPSAWTLLGAQAGLEAEAFRQSDRTDPDQAWFAPPAPGAVTAFALAGQVIAPPTVPEATRRGCLRLAGLSGEILLGVELAPGPDGRWRMTGASPAPDLMRGGEPLIAALDAALPEAAETRPALEAMS
jgi:hypothetical protein